MDYLTAAKHQASKSNLAIISKCNSAGEVINYRVYRRMPDRLIYLGQKPEPKALLKLVNMLARVEEPA